MATALLFSDFGMGGSVNRGNLLRGGTIKSALLSGRLTGSTKREGQRRMQASGSVFRKATGQSSARAAPNRASASRAAPPRAQRATGPSSEELSAQRSAELQAKRDKEAADENARITREINRRQFTSETNTLRAPAAGVSAPVKTAEPGAGPQPAAVDPISGTRTRKAGRARRGSSGRRALIATNQGLLGQDDRLGV